MDQEVARFRRAAARENRNRSDRRRYSAALQEQAVAYWTARSEAGDALQDVAMALGVSRQTLQRWTQRARFHRIEVTTRPTPTLSTLSVVISDTGLRVEGLTLERVVDLVRQLR
jgi:transposase-like protein